VSEFLFGPERKSIFPSGAEASKGERFLRDWVGSEQEFKASGRAASEGRVGAALGWGALALAGAVPGFGKALKGAAKGLGAVPDVARAVAPPPPTALPKIAPVDPPVARVASVWEKGPLPNAAERAIKNNSNLIEQRRAELLAPAFKSNDWIAKDLQRASPDILKMNPDNMWLIHETNFAPKRAKNALEIRPVGDYTPSTGRNTIHFAVNTLAPGHMLRPESNKSFVVMARLSDVMKANKGSLENLNALDTFFTPPPGQALRLPNAKILTNSGNIDTQNEIRRIIQNSGGPLLSGNNRELFTPGANAIITKWGKEFNVPIGLHDSHPSYLLEMQHAYYRSPLGDSNPIDVLALLSKNGRARQAQDNIWTHPRLRQIAEDLDV
jgi:hypothetical protein